MAWSDKRTPQRGTPAFGRGVVGVAKMVRQGGPIVTSQRFSRFSGVTLRATDMSVSMTTMVRETEEAVLRARIFSPTHVGEGKRLVRPSDPDRGHPAASTGTVAHQKLGNELESVAGKGQGRLRRATATEAIRVCGGKYHKTDEENQRIHLEMHTRRVEGSMEHILTECNAPEREQIWSLVRELWNKRS